MDDPIRIGGVFAGVGMLEAGVRLALDVLGIPHRTAFVAEWEGRASASLVAGLEAEGMGSTPVWLGDLCDLDGRELRGEVDLLCGGFPCQPFSSAGRQLGLGDDRGWGDGNGPLRHLVRLIDEIRPGVVFLENVPGVLKHFEPVWRLVRELGYEWARPLTLAASDVGANHGRKRVWLLAIREDMGDSPFRRRRTRASVRGSHDEGEAGHSRRRGAVADDDRGGRDGTVAAVAQGNGCGSRPQGDAERTDAGERGESLGSVGPAGGSGLPGGADLPLFAPARNDPRWHSIIDRFQWLAPALPPLAVLEARGALRDPDERGGRVETEPGAAQSLLRRMADGLADRSDRLRCIGNGVVSQCAAVALAFLLVESGLVAAPGSVRGERGSR